MPESVAAIDPEKPAVKLLSPKELRKREE